MRRHLIDSWSLIKAITGGAMDKYCISDKLTEDDGEKTGAGALEMKIEWAVGG